MDAQALVVGAGPAGLAVAACLGRRGVPALVLDRGRTVGDSWQARYDRLHLHTPRVQSALPGLRMPRRFGRWVSRDDMVAYLRGYADRRELHPRFGVEVRRLERDGEGWQAETGGEPVRARQVALACGYNREPVLPTWPGQQSFGGQLIHAGAYRSPEPYRGKDVLVVGAGSTGAEIAADLAEGGAGRVQLAVRTPPNVIPRQIGPVPVTLLAIPMDFSPAWLVDPLNLLQRTLIGDLGRYGLPAARSGVVAQARATGVRPTIDVGLVAQLRARRVRPVAARSPSPCSSPASWIRPSGRRPRRRVGRQPQTPARRHPRAGPCVQRSAPDTELNLHGRRPVGAAVGPRPVTPRR